MVAGTSAGTYMMLMSQFTEKGATQNEGVHQIGELSGRKNQVCLSKKLLNCWKV